MLLPIPLSDHAPWILCEVGGFELLSAACGRGEEVREVALLVVACHDVPIRAWDPPWLSIVSVGHSVATQRMPRARSLDVLRRAMKLTLGIHTHTCVVGLLG